MKQSYRIGRNDLSISPLIFVFVALSVALSACSNGKIGECEIGKHTFVAYRVPTYKIQVQHQGFLGLPGLSTLAAETYGVDSVTLHASADSNLIVMILMGENGSTPELVDSIRVPLDRTTWPIGWPKYDKY